MSEFAGFGVKWYRSFFGESPELIGPLQKMNLLAGQNNVGKSNTLRVAQELLNEFRRTGASVVALDGSVDLPDGRPETSLTELVIGIDISDGVEFLVPEEKRAGLNDPMKQALSAVFKGPHFRLQKEQDIAWFRYVIPVESRANRGDAHLSFSSEQAIAAVGELSTNDREAISSCASFLGGESGSAADDLERVLNVLNVVQYAPLVRTLPAFRQVTATESVEPNSGVSMHAREDLEFRDAINGKGIIDHLHRLQNPGNAYKGDKKKFAAINEFVKVVLDDEAAAISIPYDRTTIQVHHHGRELPLESVGTGLHQVIILAAACTLIEGEVICIEEPEIHLHPLLQRKLIRYLANKTKNSYIIATHSAHLLDSEVAAIFHVTLSEDTGTAVRLAGGPKEQAAICADLGYRPSDLVQANSVIWVEGPSDRIYLRHWISMLAPDLVEGIHYSIMFYGGRLLSHLSGDDPDFEQDFISLRKLNRHIAVMIDSDKNSDSSRLNGTKLRIRKAFDEGPGFAWITYGYAIENYVPAKMFRDAVAMVHPQAKVSWDGKRFANPFKSEQGSGAGVQINKVAVARIVVGLWKTETEWIGDLGKYVRKTVEFISAANGLQAGSVRD